MRKVFPPIALALFLLVSFLLTQAQESLPDLVRQLKPSVVAILTYDSAGEPVMSGSGFFVRAGVGVTNLHVIKGAHRADVKTLDGKGRVYAAEGVIATDEDGDLALLSV